ncbi:MAG: hypothetical protein K2W96_27970 [Gemmataceae bacterium]|nr:hypothetical protein [Gemmataceae bacterium]
MRPILLSLLMIGTTVLAAPTVPARESAARQAELKAAFESFRQKLALLAGRMETSPDPVEKERAKAVRAALKVAADRGTEGRFDSLIRALASKGADTSLDILAAAAKENKELRDDLKAMIALLLADPRGDQLKKRAQELKELREKLKEIRSRQARLQARTEKATDPKSLEKAQEQLAKETAELLKEPAVSGKVAKPLGKASEKQGKAGKALGKGKGGEAGEAMGEAVDALDDAINELDQEEGENRREREERKLRDLLARAKRMLKLQVPIRDGLEDLYLDIRKTSDEKATTAHGARANKLADAQTEPIREAEGALKLLADEGDAHAFLEVMGQLRTDMESLRARLDNVDVGKVSQRIADDIVETLKEMIAALEKAIDQNQPPPPPPPGRRPPPPPPGPLVTKLQQLKMIHAMQKRVNGRTELYGKRYEGEQAPMPGTVPDPRERKRVEIVRKELADLARRQESIRKVTAELGKPAE